MNDALYKGMRTEFQIGDKVRLTEGGRVGTIVSIFPREGDELEYCVEFPADSTNYARERFLSDFFMQKVAKKVK